MRNRILFAALVAAAVAYCVAPAQDAGATVTTSATSVTYVASGSTGTFSVTFPFQQASDLVVTDNGVTKVLSADYAAGCAGCSSGGTVVFASNPTAGHTVVISRVVPYLQTFNARSQGLFKPASYEAAFDSLEYQIQQLAKVYANPPASVLPANVTAKLNGIRFADQFANIQAAITDASTTGAVIIPPAYAGSDTFTNPNNIPIIDLRGGAKSVRGFASVKDFGAVGDGSTDDTAAFSLALTAAAGKTLYVPPGTYKITSTLTLPSYTVLVGDGPGSGNTKVKKFFNGDLINQGSASGIRNINLDGNFASFTGRTVIVTGGFGQFIDTAQIDCIGNAGGYCVEYTAANAGTQSYIINTSFFVQTAYNVAVKYPDGPDVGAAPRVMHNCQGNGSVLIDFAGANDASFTDNFTNGLVFSSTLGGHDFIGYNRLATGGAFTITVKGASHELIANSFADPIVLDASVVSTTIIGEIPGITNNGTGNVIISPGRGINMDGPLVTSNRGPHAIGGATDPDARLRLLGAFTGGTNTNGVVVADTLSVPVNGLGAGLNVSVVLNKAGSGTHATMASVDLAAPTLGGGAATVTDAATLLLRTAPTGATNNDALRIAQGTMSMAGTTQASLGTPRNGTITFCTDCTTASACTGGGTGALAVRQNGAWKCF